MRALDTNVIVRYLTADDDRQLAEAERIVEQARKQQEPLFLSAIVLCELVWVLARRYGLTKTVIIQGLEQILEMDQFEVEHEPLVRRSLTLFRSGRGDFPDYLIGEISLHHGCRDIVTFDRDLRGSAGFTVLS